MLKKFTVLVLALALIIPCLQNPLVVKAETVSKNDSKYNTIIDEILLIDGSIEATKSDLYVVSIPKQGTTQGRWSSSEDSELAIRMVERRNDVIEVTTFHPYKVAESGDLISSFEYAPKNTRDTPVFNFHLVDTVVAVTVYYNYISSIINAVNYYRHLGVRATWTSNNATVSVSLMKVRYESYGDLHRYPECLTLSQYESLVQEDYLIRSNIVKTNPYNGQICVSLDPMMPENRVLDFSHPMVHGGLVHIDVDYSVNGIAKNYWHSYDAYLRAPE